MFWYFYFNKAVAIMLVPKTAIHFKFYLGGNSEDSIF